jgi:hypothetical protein
MGVIMFKKIALVVGHGLIMMRPHGAYMRNMANRNAP